MVSENIKYNKVIHKKLKKCEFCGRELIPIGFDYLYVNYDKSVIEYERCNCEKAVQFWKEIDLEKEEKQKDDQRAGHINICQIKNRKVDQTEINKIYHILLHQTVIKIPKRAGDQYKCQQKRRQIMNGFRHADHHIQKNC